MHTATATYMHNGDEHYSGSITKKSIFASAPMGFFPEKKRSSWWITITTGEQCSRKTEEENPEVLSDGVDLKRRMAENQSLQNPGSLNDVDDRGHFEVGTNRARKRKGQLDSLKTTARFLLSQSVNRWREMPLTMTVLCWKRRTGWPAGCLVIGPARLPHKQGPLHD